MFSPFKYTLSNFSSALCRAISSYLIFEHPQALRPLIFSSFYWGLCYTVTHSKASHNSIWELLVYPQGHETSKCFPEIQVEGFFFKTYLRVPACKWGGGGVWLH